MLLPPHPSHHSPAYAPPSPSGCSAVAIRARGPSLISSSTVIPSAQQRQRSIRIGPRCNTQYAAASRSLSSLMRSPSAFLSMTGNAEARQRSPKSAAARVAQQPHAGCFSSSIGDRPHPPLALRPRRAVAEHDESKYDVPAAIRKMCSTAGLLSLHASARRAIDPRLKALRASPRQRGRTRQGKNSSVSLTARPLPRDTPPRPISEPKQHKNDAFRQKELHCRINISRLPRAEQKSSARLSALRFSPRRTTTQIVDENVKREDAEMTSGTPH